MFTRVSRRVALARVRAQYSSRALANTFSSGDSLLSLASAGGQDKQPGRESPLVAHSLPAISNHAGQSRDAQFNV